jgi:hypothetical protein
MDYGEGTAATIGGVTTTNNERREQRGGGESRGGPLGRLAARCAIALRATSASAT